MNVMEIRIRADKSGEEPPRDEQGHLTKPWPIASVDVVGDVATDHEFSVPYVTEAVERGWMELVGDRPFVYKTPNKVSGPGGTSAAKTEVVMHADELILHLASGDMVYEVVQNPGPYDPETGEPCYEVKGDHQGGPEHYEVFHAYKIHLKGAK